MRFIKAATADGPRLGVLRADGVVELSESASRIEASIGDDGEMLSQLADRIHAAPADEVPIDELALLRPVDPLAMRDFMIFEEHVLPAWRDSGLTRGPDVWYEQPIGYLSNVANILGPRDAVEMPGGTQRLDFELEVGRDPRSGGALADSGTGGRLHRGLHRLVRLDRSRHPVPGDGRSARAVQRQGFRLLPGTGLRHPG